MFETHSQLAQHLPVAEGTVYRARCPANTRTGEKLSKWKKWFSLTVLLVSFLKKCDLMLINKQVNIGITCS